MLRFPIIILLVPLTSAIQCYIYVDRQIGGQIIHGEKSVLSCVNPAFCLSIDQEGNDESSYSAICANNSVMSTTCLRTGCTHSHSNEVSTKKCCCDWSLCNKAPTGMYFLLPFLLSILFIL
ncbi:hypothetical protein Q1695_010453 [Nippostrongylus brasiliensis]|nr:hypothetical protein Q1695_010453 [Nippostrongylus brasiliensis]